MNQIEPRKYDGTKIMYHRDTVEAHFKHGHRVAPIHIDMGIAKFCNVACVFCYGKYQEPAKTYIQRDALLGAIRDASAIGVKSIAFIGDGEPTCNPHLYEAFELARDYTRLDMAMSTNGVLIDTPDKCETVLSSCRWMRFCISAGTREGYHKIHGVDRFDRVTANIERMIEAKARNGYPCAVGMQSVYIPGTMDSDMIAEARLAVALGVDYFVIKQCSLPDTGQSGMEMFDLAAYDSPKTIDTLKQCEVMSTDATRIIVKWDTIKQKGERPYKGCPSVPFISEVSGNGDWYPCGFMFGDKPELRRYRFGNLHESGLKQIFESDRYHDIIIEMRERFNSQTQCRGACRLDKTNKFCYDYLNGVAECEPVPPWLIDLNFI